MTTAHRTLGRKSKKIPVRLSYRIIELFSDGLYSSPHKAVEELVANSFDAGGSNVHVLVPLDRTPADATIAVVDDGQGMDEQGMRQHWLIGVSNKRSLSKRPKSRSQIGRFGIGKLATFVLGRYFTLICKKKRKYYATTIDYNDIPAGEDGGIHASEAVKLNLRVLTAKQAKDALEGVVTGDRPGHKAVKLFGKEAASSWTVAVMSGLKDMAKQIQLGRLTWVLRTAMPLRDDFRLYLNGKRLTPSKLDKKPIQKWVLGKDVEGLEKPAPPKDQLLVDKQTKLPSEHRYGLTHGALGRVTGYMELHEDSLSRGKERFDRSHGFFVYVRGRLINIEDPLFGLQPLHHGTFARFRMVIHMDGLDAELRSSRESLKDGPSLTVARNILHASFNRARSWLADHETPPEDTLPARLALGPRSLTRRPVLALVGQMLKGKR